jgi:hypothetical protein
VLNSFNNQCTIRYNEVIMKVMHGINVDKKSAWIICSMSSWSFVVNDPIS